MPRTAVNNPVVYNLPEELLRSLTLRNDHGALTDETPEVETNKEDSIDGENGQRTIATSCTLCHSNFTNFQDQRHHVRSDWHRYNLKLSIKGLEPIDEASFIKQIGDLDESISGSESSASESDDDTNAHSTDSTLSALLRKQAKISKDRALELHDTKPRKDKSPLLWLGSSKLEQDVALGVYRAMLSDTEQSEAPLHLVDIVRSKQLQPLMPKHARNSKIETKPNEKSPHVFLCMIGGGHFAAMIVSLAPELRKGAGGVEEQHAVVQAHKTFHRYTTRRKQGGSQSANDNAKGNAHSAGSSIRRYNEAALEVDIRTVLAEWKPLIDTAELLFIRATGSTNRRTLFGPYDGQVLNINDKRLRSIPFSTRRATQAELLRSFQELTRLKIRKITPEQPEKSKPKPAQSKADTAKDAPPTPRLTPEEETQLHHTTQLSSLIRRSKAPGTMIYLTKQNLSASTFRFFPPSDHHHAPTLLHLASSTGSAAIVTSLLLQADVDPATTNDRGQTPFDLASNQAVRDAFRLARGALGDDKIDWTAAHVPSALSQADVDARQAKQRKEDDKAEAERRQNELDRIKREDEERQVKNMERKGGTGKPTGGSVAQEKTGEDRREEEARGMTPEMRMKLERERRARAAEERMRRLQGPR